MNQERCDGGWEASRGDEGFLSLALEELPAMVAITDGLGSIYHVNDAILEETVHERSDLLGGPVTRLLSGYERDRVLSNDAVSLDLVTGDGDQFPVRVRARTIPAAPKSNPEKALALLIENRASGTDSNRDADSVDSDSIDRIFEHADDAVVLVDVETDRFVRYNHAARELLGYDPDAFGSVRPSDIHPHEYDAFTRFAEEVFERGHGWTDQLSCRACDGELIEAEISGTAVIVDDTKLLLATIRDVSTRVERERELLRWSKALAAVTDGISVLSEDGTVQYANGAYTDLFGFEDPDTIVGRHWRDLHEPSDQFELEIAPDARSSGEWRGDVTGVREGGSTFPMEVSLTRIETGEFVCVGRDVTEKRRNERRLNGLLEATRQLMAAEKRTETARVAVDAAVGALGYEITTLRLYDAAANELRRSATTDAAEALLESELAYDLKASNAGMAYRRGETVHNEPSDDAYATPSSRADLHVPIADRGVLTVIDPEGSFSDTDVQLVELLGESIRAALRRAEREERLRDRQARLEQRRDELAITDQFNTLVVDVIQSIFGSATRTETSETVCKRLAHSSLYDAACIVINEDEADTRGLEAGSIADDTSLVADPAAFVDSPFVRQLLEESTGTSGVTTTRRQFESGDDEQETLAAAVSIACGETTFGTLVLATTDPPEFGDAVRSGFTVLGEALGFAFLAERRQRTLEAGENVELEFVYESPFGELSREFDCRCIHEREVPDEDDPAYRITITDGNCEAIQAFLQEYESIKRCTVVSDQDDQCVLHVIVDNPPPSVLARTGVNLRSLIAENGETRIVVEVAADTDIETIVDHLQEHWQNVRLVAKRQRPRPLDEFAPDWQSQLTSRQESVLRTAHEKGYYEWPRDRTAEEIADALDIASSTLHQHLRAAENKLISAFLSE
jgi:PAS domain S-box-containing protein